MLNDINVTYLFCRKERKRMSEHDQIIIMYVEDDV